MVSPGFVRDVAETLIGRVFVIAIGLVTSIVVARILGPERRGLYAVAATVGALGVQFGNLGLHAANTYYVSRNRGYLPALTGNSLCVSFVFGGICSFLAWTFFIIMPRYAPLHGILLALAMASIPIGLAYLLLQNLLIAINEVRAYNVIEVGAKVIGLFLIFLLVLMNYVRLELVFFMELISILVGFFWVIRLVLRNLKEPPLPSISLLKENMRYGLKAYIAAFFAYMVLRVDLLFVKYFLGAKETGYYSIGTSMANLIYLVPAMVGVILFPRLSAMTILEEKWAFTKKILWSVAIATFLLSIISLWLADPVVKLLFGEVFLPSVPAFIWLLPGICFLSINTIFMNYFASTGFPHIAVYAPGFAMVLNIFLNFRWIPSYGIIGASMASSVSYGVMLLISIIYISRFQS